MPGPPLAKTFTYQGTPTNRGARYNTLAREVIQSNRFYLSPNTGTYFNYNKAKRENIPRNSGKGLGVGGGQTTGGFGQQ